jgi:hypothetical protein
MPKATIRSSTWAIIRVEGSQEEVAKLISDFEKTSVAGHVQEGIRLTKAATGREKERESAADLILGLREAAFFDKPKTLAEMGAALEEKGFLYPTTSLSGVVVGLVEK